MKMKAHLVFIELQEAYSKNDLNRVSEILDNLEKGIYDIELNGTISNKEQLLTRIDFLRNRLIEITKEVNLLLKSKTYGEIISIKNTKIFFEQEKERLENELKHLQNE